MRDLWCGQCNKLIAYFDGTSHGLTAMGECREVVVIIASSTLVDWSSHVLVSGDSLNNKSQWLLDRIRECPEGLSVPWPSTSTMIKLWWSFVKNCLRVDTLSLQHQPCNLLCIGGDGVGIGCIKTQEHNLMSFRQLPATSYLRRDESAASASASATDQPSTKGTPMVVLQPDVAHEKMVFLTGEARTFVECYLNNKDPVTKGDGGKGNRGRAFSPDSLTRLKELIGEGDLRQVRAVAERFVGLLREPRPASHFFLRTPFSLARFCHCRCSSSVCVVVWLAFGYFVTSTSGNRLI